ncbi:MAG: S8 family serine peptidase, partial [Planctomycetota bacterium]
SGLDGSHRDLVGNFTSYVDFVQDEFAADGTRIVHTQASASEDPDGHGTHVAGTIGSTNPNIGTAPGVNLIGLRTLGRGQRNSDLTDALQWVLENRDRYRIVAVNMSLGFPDYLRNSDDFSSIPFFVQMTNTIRSLEAAGVTVVSAAGNDYFAHAQTSGDPLRENVAMPGISSTITAGNVWQDGREVMVEWMSGATDYTTGADQVVSHSQRLSTLDSMLFAPGAFILSTMPGNQYEAHGGTSMAAPAITGVVALMQDAALQFGNRLLVPSEIREILNTTADTINDGDNEDDNVVNGGNNYRRMNAYRAVQEVRRRVTETLPPDAPPLPPAPEPPQGQSPDINGTFATARELTNLPESLSTTYRGETIIGDDSGRGNITIPSDVDMFKVTVVDGRLLVQASRSSSNVSPVLRVFNSDGDEIAINGEASPQSTSRISMQVAAGTYYIGVSGYGNAVYSPNRAGSGVKGSTGNYNFSVALRTIMPVDPDGVIGGTGVAEYRLSDYAAVGRFDRELHIGKDDLTSVGSMDVDITRIIVDQPSQVKFETFGTSVSGSTAYRVVANTVLRLFNNEGLELAKNDNKDSGSILSKLDVHLDPGVYYIGVSNNYLTYDPIDLSSRNNGGTTGTGNYRLQVNMPIVSPSDPNGTSPGAIPVSVPVAGSRKITDWIGRDGSIDVTGSGDVDLYRFQPITDGTLLVDVNTPYGPGFDATTSYVDTRLRIWQSSVVNGVPAWTELLPASLNDAATDFIGDPAEFNSSPYTTNRNGVRTGHSSDSFKRISVVRGTTYLIGVSREANSAYSLNDYTGRSPAETTDLRYDLVLSLGGATGASDIDGTISPGKLTTIDLTSGSVQRTGEIGKDSLTVGSTDVDFYRIRFNGTSSTPSRILALNVDVPAGSTLNSYVRLFDASGNLLASNNDEGPFETDSMLTVPIQANKDYYVAVTGAGNEQFNPFVIGSGGGGSTGTYTLKMSTSSPTTTPRGRLIDTLAASQSPRSLDLDREVQGLDLTAADVFAANNLDFIEVGATAKKMSGAIGQDRDAGTSALEAFNAYSTAFRQASGLASGSAVVFDDIGGADVDLYPIRISTGNFYEISSLRPGGMAGSLPASTQMKLYRRDGSVVTPASASAKVGSRVDQQRIYQLSPGDYFLAVLAEGSGADKYDFSQQNFSGSLSAAELQQMDQNSGNYEVVIQPLAIKLNSAEILSSGKLVFNLSDVVDSTKLVLNSPSGDSNISSTVRVTGPNGENIPGSSVYDAATRQLICVPLNPFLTPGQYTVQVRQQDFVTPVGNISAGTGELTFQFTVPSVASALSVARIQLNPGKTVNIGGTGTGLPVRVSDAGGLVEMTLRLQYSEDFLNVSNAVLAPGMPSGWSIQSFRKLPGQIEVRLKGSTALPTGERELIRLTAVVPSTAPVGESRVNSIDGGGRKADGSAVDFAERNAVQTVGELSPPSILSPSTNVLTQRPRLQWTAVPGAATYQIWIGNNTTLQKPVHTGQSTTTSYDVPVDLGNGRMELYVRAVLSDGTLLPWSASRRFDVTTPPTLTALSTLQTTARPTVSWGSITGVSSWDVWVSNLTAGGTLAARTTVTGNSWTPSADMTMARYRIWVRALGAGGFAGAWSSPRDFSVAPSP